MSNILNQIDFSQKKGFICDMDGVIYHGNRILPGVTEFIKWLHDEEKEYLFLTNNSAYTPRELNQKLARMGLDVPEEHFYTSALATAAFLKEQAPGCSVFVIGEAGLLNALKVVGKRLEDVKIVTSGAGAAGIAVIKLLVSAGAGNVVMTDRTGAIYNGRPGLNPAKQEIAEITNAARESGSLAEVIKGADVFIGVSAPGVLTAGMVQTMAKDAVVFACANPTPEIFPDEAKRAGAAVVSTGRSDYPNQINNVLAFPGIFRGALDARASDINDEMKFAAAHALAGMVSDSELSCDNILPQAFDEGVGETVAKAVMAAAIKSGVARI